MDWQIEKIEGDKDIRDNSTVLAVAEKMGPGSSYGGLSKADAGTLARAIEKVHGKRTSTIKARDGAFRVWRVEQRGETARKAKTAKVIGKPAAKA